MTVPCQWCGTQMSPPFDHLDYCDRMDVLEVAAMIDRGEDFVDPEARRVARALLDRAEQDAA